MKILKEIIRALRDRNTPVYFEVKADSSKVVDKMEDIELSPEDSEKRLREFVNMAKSDHEDAERSS